MFPSPTRSRQAVPAAQRDAADARAQPLLPALAGTAQADPRAQRDVQRTESRYVRDGCNDDAKAGRPLSRMPGAGREITADATRSRTLSRSVETGNAVAQQREAILQEMARFGCKRRARSAGVTQRRSARQPLRPAVRRRLSATASTATAACAATSWTAMAAIRRCGRCACASPTATTGRSAIRPCPTMSATMPQQCQAQCPGADVDLYYYDNPGQEPEQMVNSLRRALYRRCPTPLASAPSSTASASCKAPVNYGSINHGRDRRRAVAGHDRVRRRRLSRCRCAIRAGTARHGRTAAPVEAAELRRSCRCRAARPAAPGEDAEAGAGAQPAAAAEPSGSCSSATSAVRIVGPDTPYAQAAAAGT